MTITTPGSWKEYSLIDSGNGEKLERWGKFITRRPDPQAIWNKNNEYAQKWQKANFVYTRKDTGGTWNKENIPSWEISYKNLRFQIKLTSFKHTGIFPEQAVNWDKFAKRLNESDKVLNLFAYTGGATVAALSTGAEVCHVDASKGMTEMAKANVSLSGFNNGKVRFIVEDVNKFVEREFRRGNQYSAIIMDPPSYGRGAGGELWKLEKSLPELLEKCKSILTEKPKFLLLNAYANEFSHNSFRNLIEQELGDRFSKVTSYELGIKSESGLVMPCGFSVLAENED